VIKTAKKLLQRCRSREIQAGGSLVRLVKHCRWPAQWWPPLDPAAGRRTPRAIDAAGGG
jgi:hypothetical protein